MKALSQRAMVLGFLVPGDDWEKIRNTNQQVQPLPGLQKKSKPKKYKIIGVKNAKTN